MPLEFISDNRDDAWGIWRITESEEALTAELDLTESPPYSITNAQKRLEYLSARVLLKKLLEHWSMSFDGLVKNEFGKPFFKTHKIELSLSHSYPYVAAIINRKKAVGIDLEQPKPKLLRVAPRILHPDEFRNAGNDIVKHCIYWCAKESMIKVHGKKDLHFSENLIIEPFERAQNGMLIGRIVATSLRETIPLRYQVYDNFVIVLTA